MNSATLQQQIESRLAESEPDVEVLLVELSAGETVRVFIDHPDGVSLELCERVTRALAEVRERYSLEVSSPGAQRPLTKPDHYRASSDGARVCERVSRTRDGAASPESSSA